MKPFDSIEYNKLCAEFLGWNYLIRGVYKDELTRYKKEELKFDSDWNWIMEVVEKIEQTYVTDSYSRLNDDDKHEFNIWNKTTTEICGRGDTKKEAVVQAIWEFLNYYNKKSKTINK